MEDAKHSPDKFGVPRVSDHWLVVTLIETPAKNEEWHYTERSR